MKQLSFTDAESKIKRRVTRKEKFLSEMESVIPWDIFLDTIRPFYYDEKKTGRKPYPLDSMLRIYFMQLWYSSSDPAMEDALYEVSSMRQFARLDLTGQIPDETTILNFRHLLEKNDIQTKLHQKLNTVLSQNGLYLKEGTLIDATIINAPPSLKNKDKKRDPDMKSTKKGNQFYFGMKAHVGMDIYSGTAHSLSFTAANVHDINETRNLLNGEEKIIVADSGYLGAEKRKENQDINAQWEIMKRPSSIIKHATTELEITQEKAIERTKAKLRSKVEHIFRIVKCQFGFRKTKYRGLKKNADHLTMLFTLANIYQLRKIM